MDIKIPSYSGRTEFLSMVNIYSVAVTGSGSPKNLKDICAIVLSESVKVFNNLRRWQ